MKKTLLEVYALAVCFFTVVCFAVVLGLALYDVVGIVDPEFTMAAHIHKSHANNDSYWQHLQQFGRGVWEFERPDGAKDRAERPSEDELTKRRERSYAEEVAAELRESKQGLVRNIIILFVDLVVFVPHWIVARRARSQSA